MKISGVPLSELSRIADDLGLRLEMDDVSNSRGLRATGRLMPPRGAANPYQRISASPFSDGRRVHAVCWHGFRDFMRAVFNAYPEARIQTGMADYRGARDFEDSHRDTGRRNIGAPIAPMTMAEACQCPESGDVSGIDARVQAVGPLSREEVRELAGYWHSGQTSALYALSSSGFTHADSALAEIEECKAEVTAEPAATAKLVRLAEWIEAHRATLDPMAGRVNYDPERGA